MLNDEKNTNSNIENLPTSEEREGEEIPNEEIVARVKDMTDTHTENVESTKEAIEEIIDPNSKKELNEEQNKINEATIETVENFAVDTSMKEEIDIAAENENIERRKEYDEMTKTEREAEIQETSKRFREDLEISENQEISEEEMEERKETYFEETEEYYENQNDCLEIEEGLKKLAQGVENLDLTDTEDLKKFEKFLEEFAKKQGELVKLLKYEYLLAEKNDLDFDQEGHIERMVLIDTVEDMQRLAEKDLKNMSPEEVSKLRKTLGALGALAGLGALAYLAAELGKSATIPALKGFALKGIEVGALGAKAGAIGGVAGKVGIAGIFLLILEHMSVEDVEKLTGTKAPWWLKKKKNDF